MDKLALTSSTNKSFVFINISLIKCFSILFWPMFWAMKNQSSITCLKKYFWELFCWTLIWWNAKKCSFKQFWRILTPKMENKYLIPQHNLAYHHCKYLSFVMRYYFSKLDKNLISIAWTLAFWECIKEWANWWSSKTLF